MDGYSLLSGFLAVLAQALGGVVRGFRMLANCDLFQLSKQNLGGKLLCASEKILVQAYADKKK